MTKEIFAGATAGVYAEVIKQVYDSLDKRIREAVSNADDAHATKVKISVFQADENKIVIYDNGDGMDENDIVEKYVRMGGGDNYSNGDTIGRIGIGALSVFALGSRITINTRKKGSDKILRAELDLKPVLDEGQHSTSLTNLKLGTVKCYRMATPEDEAHFTEINIFDISKSAWSILGDLEKTQELIERLERILPVPYRSDDLIFEKLSSDVSKKINSEKYIIEDVSLHIPHLGFANPDYKIYRKSITSVDDVNIIHTISISPFRLEGGVNSDLAIYGYLSINADKVLPKDWRGINARIKNVTIESNTFFGYEEDQASRDRIGGELFIVNIDENHAITTNRSGFATENPDYVLVAQYMRDWIAAAADIVRRHSAVDSIVKARVRQLEKLRQVFEKNVTVQDGRDDASLFKAFDDAKIVCGKDVLFSLENDLKRELDRKKVEFELEWSGTLEGLLYDIRPQEDNFYSIFVNNRFQEFKFNVAGNLVEYAIGYWGEHNPLLIKKPGRVQLNLDNALVPDKDLMNIEIGLVEALLMLYLNYLRCNNNAEVLYRETTEDLAKMY